MRFCVPLSSSISGPSRFPFPRPAILPAGRGGNGVVLPLACLPVHLIGTVAVCSCGRAVSLSRLGSLP